MSDREAGNRSWGRLSTTTAITYTLGTTVLDIRFEIS